MKDYIVVIGGGLAGCEAAYQIAKREIKVKLYEMKPTTYSPAHSNEDLAEIVCSNSFKSDLLTNACGLLKEELRRLDSLLIKIADETKVPAGQALAVDRELFSKKVTEDIDKNKLIEIVRKEVKSKNCIEEREKIDIYNKDNTTIQEQEYPAYIEDLIEDGIVIIATGPLTSDNLSAGIRELIGDNSLHFYDAAAPIIEKDSINFDIAFYGDRYVQEKRKDETLEEWHRRIKLIEKPSEQNITNKNITEEEILNDNNADDNTLSENSYINLPMNKEEYESFYNELIKAEVAHIHEFEKGDIFEGCMPIEIMAKRGIDTLRFGPLKPVGFDDPRTGKRPYAVVQLRQDNAQGSMYNMVGFQTNLKFGEQKRVFSMIPGLENAEFVKYGVMHRNTFINSAKLLDSTYNFKENQNIFFAGQITGVEGYVESISSGLVAGINASIAFKNIIRNTKNYIKCTDQKQNVKDKESNYKNDSNLTYIKQPKIEFSEETMIGALAKYISTPNDNFEPMNANFGILPSLENNVKDKKKRYEELSKRALEKLNNCNENL